MLHCEIGGCKQTATDDCLRAASLKAAPRREPAFCRRGTESTARGSPEVLFLARGAGVLLFLALGRAVPRVHPSADHGSLFGRRSAFDLPCALRQSLADGGGGSLRGHGFLRGGGVGIARTGIHLAAVNVHRQLLDDHGAIGSPKLYRTDEKELMPEPPPRGVPARLTSPSGLSILSPWPTPSIRQKLTSRGC